MGKTLTEKLIAAHLVSGSMEPGAEVALRIDQTLTQDATGTMAYLEFESMGIDRVKTKRSVAYIDHNTLQSGFENADDHRYIQSVAAKHGIWFSRPGNGICHQVHLERFGVAAARPSSAPTATPPPAAASGCWPSARAGMDVAVAMGGGAYYITMPKVIKVEPDRCAAPLRHRQGHQPGGLAAPLRQGRRGACDRMGRSRASSRVIRSGAGHHHQYGHGTGGYHLHLPLR